MDDKYQVMPPLTDEEYAELKADIVERGVMVPIEFDEDGNILDGYHRYKICQELGIKDYPTVIRAGMSESDKFTHARKLNMARRHLNQEQRRSLIREQIKATPEKPDYQIAQDLGVDHKTVTAQREKLESDWEIPNHSTVVNSQGRERPRHYSKPVTVYNPSNRDSEALKDPDIVERMATDESLNVAGAIREQKRDQLVQHLESVETQEAKAVEGVYDVIVIDPPWPMERIESDARPHAVAMDYPVMDVEEIKAMDIPAADDCHIFLWTTQKYLPTAFDVLGAWGFKYVCTFVWHKDNGYKPFGLPKYNCEFCLYAHNGSPKFIDETQFWTCFDAPITGHSEKPDTFYKMICRVTAGRRLDMFNRRQIDGFDAWGNEAKDE
ncbi:MAG: ParB N-terminal domain-containing protein [Bacteroidales bacterium]|nr:ParB N-terminal domain-containing protein [Bacteroidales bacterium]